MSAFFSNIGVIPAIVLVWLLIYFVITLWVFVYKFFILSGKIKDEKQSLQELFLKNSSTPKSALYQKIASGRKPSKELCNLWILQVTSSAQAGLSILSIIASTAPFIGLFGTVVEILEAFSKLGGGQASFDIIGPIISKALVATACGILAAIPAYSFFVILRSRVYSLINYVRMQTEFVLDEANK